VSEAALLIGNSDGIGLAMTRRLLERGFAVTGVSRSPSPVSHQAYRHIVLNVSSADYGARLDAALPSDRIRLCVYCAGIGDHFAIDGLRQDVATLEVNLIGLARTVERVLPRMVADGPAVFAGLSVSTSLGGRLPSPPQLRQWLAWPVVSHVPQQHLQARLAEAVESSFRR
jgi:short-subunit dehydrogenase